MAELTIEALASDLRVEAREQVLKEAREAWIDVIAKVAKIVDPFTPIEKQMEVTLAVIRLNKALGVVGPFIFVTGKVPAKPQEH
jgi:hypothetical protein